jgi:MFS family permease
MHRLFRMDLNNKEDRNIWYFSVEVIWETVLGAAIMFNSAYALRLGASNTDIGLLSSIPALINVILSIPAGRFLQKKRKRYPWVIGLWTLYHFGYLLVALVPFIHIPGISPGLLVVLVICSLTILVMVSNIGFTDVFASITPAGRRASVIVAQNFVYFGGVSLCTFLFGLWLDLPSKGSPWKEWFGFPVNYQIMYGVASILVQLSLYSLLKVDVPESIINKVKQKQRANARQDAGEQNAEGQPTAGIAIQVEAAPLLEAPSEEETAPPVDPLPITRVSIREQLRNLHNIGKQQPNFLRLLIATILYSIGAWSITPLSIILMVRKFGATDGWIGLNGTLANFSGMLGWLVARWLTPRFGESKLIKYIAPVIGMFSVALGLSPALNPILAITVLSNLISPGFSLSQTNLLLKAMPEESRPEYFAFWISLTSLGAFICPLIGVALANVFGVAPVIIGGGVVSIVASIIYWIVPMEHKETQV